MSRATRPIAYITLTLLAAGAVHLFSPREEPGPGSEPFSAGDLKRMMDPEPEKLDAMTKYWMESPVVRGTAIRVTTEKKIFETKGHHGSTVEDPRIVTTFSLPNKAGGYTRIMTLQTNIENQGGQGITAYYDRSPHDKKDFLLIDPRYKRDLHGLINWFDKNKNASAPPRIHPESRYCLL